MSFNMWFGVVAAALMVTASGGSVRHARQATCTGGDTCISLRVCRPLQDLLSSNEPGSRQKVSDAICGRGPQGDILVCCPDVTGTVTPPVITDTPMTTSTPVITTPNIPPNPAGERLLPVNCGQGSTLKIFFGENAALNAFPWMVLMGYGNRNNPQWNCGGALITDRYVLTAAHCVHRDYTGGTSLVTLRLGEHNITTNPDCTGTDFKRCAPAHQDFTPENIIIHEFFDKRAPVSDDIALVRLNRKAMIGGSVQPLCLPASDLDVKTFVGDRKALVAGWGSTEISDSSDILKKVSIPFAEKRICEPHYPGQLVDEQVCFGGEGRKDSCFGDSGGPLFQTELMRPRHVLLGVVSRGLTQCGTPGGPAVYTHIPSYRNWITSKLRP